MSLPNLHSSGNDPAQNPHSSGNDPAQNPQRLLDSAISLVQTEMEEVDHTIQSRLKSDIALINNMGAYITQSGGKRLRPLILLLSARCCNYPGNHHILLSAIIEMIHTATLLHDDVVDASVTRRGQPTANIAWGNEASVLIGDFLYSRSFQMMVEIDNMEVMRILSETTNDMTQGEVMQLLNAHCADLTETQYFDTIRRKTAKLFEASALLGGSIANRESGVCRALANYGIHLGAAFQMVDDILDYDAQSRKIGKDVGDDLAEGKPTLPLIHALKQCNDRQKQVITTAIEQGDRTRMNEILAIVRSTGALDYTFDLAQSQARLAQSSLRELPDNEYRAALDKLAEFSILRQY